MSEPIVFDIGSHTAYLGLGGNDAPSHGLQLSSYFTNGNDAKILDSGSSENVGLGGSVGSSSSPFSLPFPFFDPRPSAHIFNSRGIVEDWGMIERLWSVTDLAGERLLLSESMLNRNAARAKTLEILIEGQGCASVCLSPCSLLSLFASGRTDGSVFELGHSSSFASALYEGSVFGVAYTPLGGADVSAAIAGDVWEGVLQRDESSHTGSDQTGGKRRAHNHLLLSSIPTFFSAVDDVKRQMASLFEKGEADSLTGSFEYALWCPDGTQLSIEVGSEAHQRAAGVLFSPETRNPSALLSSAPSVVSRENSGYSAEEVTTLLEQFMANKYQRGCFPRGTPPPAVSSLIRSLLLQISGADVSEEGSPITSRAIQLASTSSPLFTRDVLLTGGTSLFQGLDTALTRAIKKDWSNYRKNDQKHATHDEVSLSSPPTTISTCPKGSGEALSLFDKEFESESGSFGFSVFAERRHLTWIGGSILSTLSAFDQMSCSRAEYDEHGAGGIATMKAANAFKHVDRV